MMLKVALVALIVCLAVVDAAHPNHEMRFARRRRDVPLTAAGKSFSCKAAAAKGDEAKIADYAKDATPDAGAKVKYAGGKWTYNAGTFRNTDGGKADGTQMLAWDLCAVWPTSICKQFLGKGKDFCEGAGKGNCCPLAGGNLAAVGKRTNGGKGCPPGAKVAGMPRSFMPQILFGKRDVFAKWLGKGDPKDADAKMADLYPSQDEMFFANTHDKVCGGKNFGEVPCGTVPRLAICNDNYILDGHHRYSTRFLCKHFVSTDGKNPCSVKSPPCNNPVKGGTEDPALIPVEVWGDTCANIITKVQDLIDYQGKGNLINNVGQVDAAAQGLEFKAGAFVELEALFGRSSNQNEATARAKYVAITAASMAEKGFELKGGLDALEQYWDAHHAPRLWA